MEIENFRDYFLGERRIFLENINYETVKSKVEGASVHKLGVRDTLVAQLMMPAGVKLVFNRRLSFEPEEHFTLSVSFGVLLHFNPEVRDLVDWQQVNLVEAFSKNYPHTLSEMTARTTQLVAQITSSAGGAPIITQMK